jgi:hypothetical protein
MSDFSHPEQISRSLLLLPQQHLCKAIYGHSCCRNLINMYAASINLLLHTKPIQANMSELSMQGGISFCKPIDALLVVACD